MNIFNFFIGVKGEFLQALLLLPVILLIWAFSLELHKKRKRRSYVILSNISMVFAIFTGITVLAALTLSALGRETQLFSSIIGGISNAAYVTLLFGYFRIHNKADLKTLLVFIGPAALSAITGIVLPLLGNVICLLSIGAIFFLHGRKLGRGQQNLISSSLFGLSLLISSITNLVPDIHGAVYMVGRILPTAAYTLLLINLLVHSMVIMQSSYVSAITDPLTGLFNRRYLTRFITTYIERNYPVNVIFSDIDNFKTLNDTKGHKVGDEVLKQVATIFMEEVEGIGVAGRYGGEEMVMLIQDTDIDMNELTERMRVRIEKETIVTASIGYRLFEAGVAPDQLIKQADVAMYIAKENGKNCVVRYTRGNQTTATTSPATNNGVGNSAMSHG
ncbi:GGDEF domain-containing protein [Paenibacillus oralis]|uniref:GGDEF domain-containing protein n=1 Tax=Paenibacillus oralis TaxID=2490856 RepID=A0A3P3TBF7_9BACL|nr:GGDEF domain-containing protein [Paenibacillus oralis]RRJ54864.1 GGDEF domain-containing protein [Paenibacillus oralis]